VHISQELLQHSGTWSKRVRGAGVRFNSRWMCGWERGWNRGNGRGQFPQ